jgi:hypothetical protein
MLLRGYSIRLVGLSKFSQLSLSPTRRPRVNSAMAVP